MTNNMNTDEQLDYVADVASGENFEGEVWLSTDGKQTVRVKASTVQGRKAALVWAKAVYERIVENYGTKQAQAVKEYSKPATVQTTIDQAACTHPNTVTKVSGPQAKNPGKAFKQCPTCNKFMGWA